MNVVRHDGTGTIKISWIKFSFQSLVLFCAYLRSVYVVNISSVWLMAGSIFIGITILIRNSQTLNISCDPNILLSLKDM